MVERREESPPGGSAPSWLPPASGLRILEVGCGDADDIGDLWATGRVAELTGVDLDETAVVRARARWPQARFLCADAAHLPETYRHRFDIVLIRRPDLLAQPGRWQRVFAVARAYLRPGGRVVAVVLGVAEAAVARRWLERSGLDVVQAPDGGGTGEQVLVAQPAAWPAVWDDAGDAAVCDTATGVCISERTEVPARAPPG